MIPIRYRKKPVVIEAMQVSGYTQLLPPDRGNGYEGGEIWRWMREHGADLRAAQMTGPVYGIIPTLEGEMRVDIGDWIIRGVKGEFYPCKPDIFDATYDRAEP